MSSQAQWNNLHLDFRKNVLESKMMHDKKFMFANIFNWISFSGAVCTLLIGLFIVISTSSIMAFSKLNPTDDDLLSTFNFINNQFKVTEWLLVTFIIYIGSTAIVSIVFYFLFLKGSPSLKIIKRATATWVTGIVLLIGSLLMLFFAYKSLNVSYYKYENLAEKMLICGGGLLTIISSCLILVPNIMIQTGHLVFKRAGKLFTAFDNLGIATTVFASLEIGFAGFGWIFLLGAGVNDLKLYTAGWSFWSIGNVLQIILILLILARQLVESPFDRSTASVVKSTISNVAMLLGFLISFYFIAHHYYANSQTLTFDFLAIFKIFVPTIYLLIIKKIRYKRVYYSI